MNLLASIHNAPEATRNRVATAISIALSLLVFAVWATSFPGLVQQSTESDSAKAAARDNTFSILQTLRGSGALIYQVSGEALGFLRDKLSAPREVIITPQP